jgi:hypothetical protein
LLKIRQIWRKFLWLSFGLLLGVGSLYGGHAPPDVVAQSAGDKLSTPTPPNQVWVGRLVSNTLGVTDGQGSIFRVSIQGLRDVPIELRNGNQLLVANSGSKPEYGTFAAEFAPVSEGTWTMIVPSLGASLEVAADNYNLAVIEFAPVPGSEPSQPVLDTATPAPTPLAATETPTALPTATETVTPQPPSFTPTPVTRWLGLVAARSSQESLGAGQIEVRVVGIEGLAVRLNDGISVERRCITGQAGLGQDKCAFDDLKPGQYLVAPEGLGVDLPVTLFGSEALQVNFEVETLAAGVAGWQGRLLKNSSGSQALPQAESIIRVHIAGQDGQVAALRSVRGIERFCEVTANPVLGHLACEFGQLGAGVYTVEAINTGAVLRVFVDGAGQADIEFAPTATVETLIARQAAPVVGRGARPVRLEPPPVPTATPIPANTPIPAPVIEPTPSPSDTPPPPPPTATPALAWRGYVVESRPIGGGVIAVRVVGLKDHQIVVRSGLWQSPVMLSGSKPELGEYGAEFAGLGPARYTVELVGLAQIDVDLPSGQFVLVEFRQE